MTIFQGIINDNISEQNFRKYLKLWNNFILLNKFNLAESWHIWICFYFNCLHEWFINLCFRFDWSEVFIMNFFFWFYQVHKRYKLNNFKVWRILITECLIWNVNYVIYLMRFIFTYELSALTRNKYLLCKIVFFFSFFRIYRFIDLTKMKFFSFISRTCFCFLQEKWPSNQKVCIKKPN